MSTANKELSRRFTELFSTGDEVLADEVLAPDVVFHGTTGDGELRGIDEMKAFVAQYRRAFPDARSTVHATPRAWPGPPRPTTALDDRERQRRLGLLEPAGVVVREAARGAEPKRIGKRPTAASTGVKGHRLPDTDRLG